MFMKRSKGGGFVRYGPSVELIVDRDDGYIDILEKSSEALSLPPKPTGYKLSLLSGGGAIINQVDNGVYMRHLHRGPRNVKFGIGFVKERVSIEYCKDITFQHNTMS